MLERLELDTDASTPGRRTWRARRLFHRLAARAGRLREFAAAIGRAWVAGHTYGGTG